MQEVLINAVYQGPGAMDPWSQPASSTRASVTRAGIGRIRPHHDRPRTALRSLRECCEVALRQDIPGDFVETGVWRGGAAIAVAAVLAAHEYSDRKGGQGFDSFQGLP